MFTVQTPRMFVSHAVQGSTNLPWDLQGGMAVVLSVLLGPTQQPLQPSPLLPVWPAQLENISQPVVKQRSLTVLRAHLDATHY